MPVLGRVMSLAGYLLIWERGLATPPDAVVEGVTHGVQVVVCCEGDKQEKRLAGVGLYGCLAPNAVDCEIWLRAFDINGDIVTEVP